MTESTRNIWQTMEIVPHPEEEQTWKHGGPTPSPMIRFLINRGRGCGCVLLPVDDLQNFIDVLKTVRDHGLVAITPPPGSDPRAGPVYGSTVMLQTIVPHIVRTNRFSDTFDGPPINVECIRFRTANGRGHKPTNIPLEELDSIIRFLEGDKFRNKLLDEAIKRYAKTWSDARRPEPNPPKPRSKTTRVLLYIEHTMNEAALLTIIENNTDLIRRAIDFNGSVLRVGAISIDGKELGNA